MGAPLLTTECPALGVPRRGKVRDVYDLGDGLLMVATDRLSAFDVVMPTPIPRKGEVLTAMSLFWFDLLGREAGVRHHLLASDVARMPAAARPYADQLRGRSMWCVKAEVFPVECVVRGYLVGSGWKDYQKSGRVCGVRLPAGLRLCDKLPEPIFTPATKAAVGHDENIDFAGVANLVGQKTAEALRKLSLDLYARAARHAEGRGIILADTKFEFGLARGEILLVDEVLTPDSSRFWSRAAWTPGRNQASFDKQYVRDYLETLDWNKQAPGPALPALVVANTTGKYLEAYRLLTGNDLGGGCS
ncbi:MAG: phosphoribosylaminoimidazolesuccinocarboxamide synthase [Planctomycetes bacterium]|nr:phosphoribosylaminoimidazolesuccinocarboxamide synthase [Planctomycetota bacterium]